MTPAPAGRLARVARRVVVAVRGACSIAALAVACPLALQSQPPDPPDPSATVGASDTAAVRLDAGRFTVVAYPADLQHARALLAAAQASDTFPGLPRPRARAVIAIAPDERRFRQWIGPRAPEWGVAVAFPAAGRIVMRGSGAGAARYAPLTVLRHELAHLALHEAMGDLPPRWFDEGYASFAAGEWGREEMLAANVALLFRRVPPLDTLDRWLTGRSAQAQGAYALSHRAVAELAALDAERGLTLLFRYWRESARLDPAIRRAYGLTLDAFEERWQARTRYRYGLLALAGNLGMAALFLILVTTPFVLLRRRRDRERMEALRAADRRADAAAAAALAAIAVALGGTARSAVPADSGDAGGAEPPDGAEREVQDGSQPSG